MYSLQKKPSSFASLFIIFIIVHKGSSQDPCDESVSVGVAGGPITVPVDGSSSAVPVPVCIRCGYSVGFTFTPVVDPSLVTYVNNTNGQTITMNTTDIIITNNGLILNDSASSFDDGESITCNFNDGPMSGSHIITIDIFIFNPPPITPVGDILDYIEGDTVTLTCTGDSQINNDLYQWTLPDGTLDPENPAIADTGLNLLLTNINRAQSGVYICTGIIPAEIVKSNVTLNIQYVTITSFTPDNSTVTVGSILTLNCTFDGNPSPSVLWSHNGSILDVQNDPNLTETITDTYSLLNIVYNGGIAVYGCIVNNTISSDETTITIYPASSSTTVMPSSTGQSTTPSLTTAPFTTATSTTTITTTKTPTNAYQVEAVAYIVPIVVCLVAVFIIVSIVLCIFLLHKHLPKQRPIITQDKTTNEYFANPSNSQDTNNSTPLIANANPVYATVIKKKTSIVVVNEERTETPPPEIIPFDDTLPSLTNDDTLPDLTNDVDTLPDLTSHDANNEQSLVEENKKKLENVFEESGNVSKKKSSNEIIYAELNILKRKRNTNPPSLPSSTATNTAAQNNIIYSTIQGIEQPPPVPVIASLCPHSSIQNVFEESGTVSEKKSSNEIIYAELNILKKRNTNPPSTATNTAAQNNIIYSTIVGIEQPPPVPKRTLSTKQMKQQRLHSELRELTYSAEGKPASDQDGDDMMTSSMVTKLL